MRNCAAPSQSLTLRTTGGTMAERVKWVTHRGHWVLRIDYSGLKGDEMLPIIAQVPTFYKGRTKGTVSCLIDMRDSYTTDEAVNAMKLMVKDTTREYDKKVAVL